jgi:hypothetical protein
VVSSRRAQADRSTFAPTTSRVLATALVTVPASLLGLGIEGLVSGHQPTAIAETTLATAALGLGLVVGERFWQASRAWGVKTYWVSGRPAVRYESAAGDYIKFEGYHDGVSANWSTDDGPEVLIKIPLKSDPPPRAQFWTSEIESEEVRLSTLAPDIQRRRSEGIRAWVETDDELVVWRLADAEAAGIAQLGVLMRSWNPERVRELVNASATKAVQSTLDKWFKAASEWVDFTVRGNGSSHDGSRKMGRQAREG